MAKLSNIFNLLLNGHLGFLFLHSHVIFPISLWFMEFHFPVFLQSQVSFTCTIFFFILSFFKTLFFAIIVSSQSSNLFFCFMLNLSNSCFRINTCLFKLIFKRMQLTSISILSLLSNGTLLMIESFNLSIRLVSLFFTLV